MITVSRNKIMLFGLALIFIFIITFWIIISEQSQDKPVSKTDTNVIQKRETGLLKDAELVLYNNNKSIQWKLASANITQTEVDYSLLKLASIEIKAYKLNSKVSTDKKLVYSITASKGKYINNNQINLDGKIKLKKNNYKLTLGNLQWFQEDDLIKGDDGFKLKAPSFLLKGNRFESNLSFNSITVSGTKTRQAHFSWKEN